LDTWLASGPYDIDALILDLGTPEAARSAVADVRARGLDVPIVLIVDAAADGLDALPRCVVLRSPVDPDALRDAINGLRSEGQAAIGGTGGSPHLVSNDTPLIASDLMQERVTEYRISRKPSRQRLERETQNGTAAHRPETAPPAISLFPEVTTEPAGDVPTHDTRSPPTEAMERTGPQPTSAVALVRALLVRVGELDGLAAITDVVVKSGVERTGADAGAVLVPDGDQWSVAGGMGLRPVEHRFQLASDSWLVREVALGSRGVIIEDSDIARSRLRGAPLASWRHLIAAPVPRVGAVILLARRDDPPFDEGALAHLAAVAEEASPHLAASIDVRALARALDGFRDDD